MYVLLCDYTKISRTATAHHRDSLIYGWMHFLSEHRESGLHAFLVCFS